MARRYTRAGQSALTKADKAAARRWFVKGIRSYPGYYRPWIFLGLSWLPVNAVEGIYDSCPTTSSCLKPLLFVRADFPGP